MAAQDASGIWNLPVTNFPDRAAAYWDVPVKAGLASRPLDILEIGVFKAALLKKLLERTDLQVDSYTGVDPFAGDKNDSYKNTYWENEDKANSIWVEAQKVFQAPNHKLIRDYSHEFYGKTQGRTWDLIIVDGDHRYSPALWDLHHWFKRLAPGGILMADDYANVDTPEVTRAVNDFIRMNKANILKKGFKVIPFQNKHKEIPISLTVVFFMKVESPVETVSWNYGEPPPQNANK